MYTRLAEDKKLRKNVRAMLDDLDNAGERLRRKETHRLRNIVLALAGIAAAVVAVPKVRAWIGGEDPEPHVTT